MKKQSQNERVISCLNKKGYITADLARQMGIKNLRARITELRKAGYAIESERQERLKFVNSKGQRRMQAYHISKYILA